MQSNIHFVLHWKGKNFDLPAARESRSYMGAYIFPSGYEDNFFSDIRGMNMHEKNYSVNNIDPNS